MSLRTGAVICIAGEAPDKWSEDDEFGFRKRFSNFEAVQIITPQLNSLMLYRILFTMLSGGITDLVIVKARFSENGKLEFSGKKSRLPMIGMN